MRGRTYYYMYYGSLFMNFILSKTKFFDVVSCEWNVRCPAMVLSDHKSQRRRTLTRSSRRSKTNHKCPYELRGLWRSFCTYWYTKKIVSTSLVISWWHFVIFLNFCDIFWTPPRNRPLSPRVQPLFIGYFWLVFPGDGTSPLWLICTVYINVKIVNKSRN